MPKGTEPRQPTASSTELQADTQPDAEEPRRPRYLKPPGSPEAPLLVPARMLNELLYCERLMYLEWVQGEWADNFFTTDGKAVHRRADRPGRPLSAPRARDSDDDAPEEPEERPYTARSVWLSSETLGITAKVDVIDVEGQRVVPIEYKRGSRPDVPEGAYLPERAQLCAQVLLLREHGFECDEAAIYFAADRQRVAIDISEGLIAITRAAVARALELVQRGELPPPLEDSPKCRGCSLVGICLPDEVNALRKGPFVDVEEAARAVLETDGPTDPWGLTPEEEADHAPAIRLLYAARDDQVPLYVQDQGARVRLSGERLSVTRPNESAIEARLSNTSHVSLFGNVQISTQALRSLMDAGIPVAFFSYGGWYAGRVVGTDTKNVELRLAQYRATQDPAFCLKLACGLVTSKILNCRTMLRRNHSGPDPVAMSELRQLSRKAREAASLQSLLGLEGTAARVYFGQFTGMLKGTDESVIAFDLAGRNRRPPRDPINALLSFAYALLLKDVQNALSAVGLDPLLGFYHQPRFGRPGLPLDLMEEFRPLVADSAVINAINNGVVQPGDFIHAAGAVNLKAPARKRLILAYERRMDQLVTHPIFDYRVSYRRVLELQARLLSRLLLGEIKEYPAFRTR